MDLRFEIKKILGAKGRCTTTENLEQFISIARECNISDGEIIFIIKQLMDSRDSFFVGTNNTIH